MRHLLLFQALMTIRADAMGQLSALPVLLFGVETFHLGVVSLERYQEIIEGPARAAKREVEGAWPGGASTLTCEVPAGHPGADAQVQAP